MDRRCLALLIVVAVPAHTAAQGPSEGAPVDVAELVDPQSDAVRLVDWARAARALDDDARSAARGQLAEHGEQLRERLRARHPAFDEARIDAELRASTPILPLLRATAIGEQLLAFDRQPTVGSVRDALTGEDACRRAAAVWLLLEEPDLAGDLGGELEALFAMEAWEDVPRMLLFGKGGHAFQSTVGRPFHVAYRIPLARLLVDLEDVGDGIYEHAILQLFDAGFLDGPPSPSQQAHALERLRARPVDSLAVRLRILEILDGEDRALQSLALPVFEGLAVVPVKERCGVRSLAPCVRPIPAEGDPLERDRIRDLTTWSGATDLHVKGVLARRVRQTRGEGERERWRTLFYAWR